MPSAGLRPRSPSRWQCADGDSLAARWGREAVGPSSEDFVRWKASSIETFFFLAYNAQFVSQLWLAIPISIVHLSFLIILYFLQTQRARVRGINNFSCVELLLLPLPPGFTHHRRHQSPSFCLINSRGSNCFAY
jgi:hypothetical protein